MFVIRKTKHILMERLNRKCFFKIVYKTKSRAQNTIIWLLSKKLWKLTSDFKRINELFDLKSIDVNSYKTFISYNEKHQNLRETQTIKLFKGNKDFENTWKTVKLCLHLSWVLVKNRILYYIHYKKHWRNGHLKHSLKFVTLFQRFTTPTVNSILCRTESANGNIHWVVRVVRHYL